MSFSQDAIVLVTGATGAVGPCVVRALCEAGYAIRTLSLDRPQDGRSGIAGTEDGRQTTDDTGQATDNERWPSNIETRIGDVIDPAAVQSAMQGVDAGNS